MSPALILGAGLGLCPQGKPELPTCPCCELSLSAAVQAEVCATSHLGLSNPMKPTLNSSFSFQSGARNLREYTLMELLVVSLCLCLPWALLGAEATRLTGPQVSVAAPG